MTSWTPSDSRRLLSRGILAANFHELRPENRDEAETRLSALARFGSPWRPDVDSSGEPIDAADERPRVFVGFYDGYRDTALWGADVCDRLGLRATFFPIFVGTEPGQAGVSDRELGELAERHDIGFHTDSHLFITEVDESNVAVEVTGPVRRIEAAIGRLPTMGAWCGGTRFNASAVGNRVLRSLGVRYLISNWSIEPIPPEQAST